MKKKIFAGAVTLLSVAVLAACSSSSNGQDDVVTMKGNTVTVGEFYDQVKTNNAAQEVLLQMTIKKVFEEKYGKNVTDKEVNEAFDKMKEAYGAAFNQVLSQSGMTEDTYRDQIRTNKLVEYAVKKAAEKELTEENYKAAFEGYTPEVTTQVIKLDSEDKAKEILEQAKAEGADFAQLAKENSTDTATKDKGGELKFDSATRTVPEAVKQAAFKLNENGLSDVVAVPESQTTFSYYIVKVTKKTEKSSNWKDYEAKLKDAIVSQKENDATFIRSVVGQELKEANVKVKDAAFQNVFAQYTDAQAAANSTPSAAPEQSSSSAGSESSSAAESSSAEESSSAAE